MQKSNIVALKKIFYVTRSSHIRPLKEKKGLSPILKILEVKFHCLIPLTQNPNSPLSLKNIREASW
jgi:hypothetical protein